MMIMCHRQIVLDRPIDIFLYDVASDNKCTSKFWNKQL